MRRLILLLLIPCLCVTTAAADEKPLTEVAAVERVLAAVKDEDAEGLKALAARSRPDPWLVVDRLCTQDEHAAAQAFAAAAAQPDAAKMRAFAAARESGPLGAEVRAALVRLRQAIAKVDQTALLQAAKELSGVTDLVVVAQTQFYVGRTHHMRRATGPAVAAYREAGAAAEKLGWLRWADECHFKLGTLLLSAGRGAEATLALEAKVETSRKLGSKSGMAVGLSLIGQYEGSVGRYEAARTRLQTAIALLEEAGPPRFLGRALGMLGNTESRAGNNDAAIDLFERAVEIADQVKDLHGVIPHLFNLNIAYSTAGRLHDALVAARRAVAAADARTKAGRLVGPKLYVACLNMLCDAAQRAGAAREALAAAERCVPLAVQTSDPRDDIRALRGRAMARIALGDHEDAAAGIAELETRARALGHGESLVLVLMSKGSLAMARGRLADALATYEEAAQLAKTSASEYTHWDALNNIALVRKKIGDLDGAARIYEEILAAARKAGDKPSMGTYALNLGLVVLDRGAVQAALAHFNEALKHGRETGSKHLEAKALTNLGLTRNRLGQFDEAMVALETALALKKEISDLESLAYTELGIADALAGAGRTAEAVAAYDKILAELRQRGDRFPIPYALHHRAIAQYESGDDLGAMDSADQAVLEAQKLSSGFGEIESARAREFWGDVYACGQAAAHRAKAPARMVRFVEGARGMGLLHMLQAGPALKRALLPDHLYDELREAEHAERAAQRKLSSPRVRRRRKEARAARKELDAARGRMEAASARIQREAGRAAAVVHPRPDELATIQRRLRKDQALVLYTFARSFTFALVIRQDTAHSVRLADRTKVLAACEELLAGGGRYVNPQGVAKAQALLVDALGLGEDVRQILVGPTGRLGYIPFGMLCGDRTVVYVPSATVQGALREPSAPRGTLVLALGNPDYGAGPRGAHRAGKLAPLPATGIEAMQVGDRVLLKEKATENGFTEALKSEAHWRAVHLACHGIVDAARPMFSHLALTADESSDGMLTYHEIFRLKVPADLVVLSACETAKGKIFLTEGIVGLTRAFMYAGAPRVICSLWKVDDEATRALMERFYALWNPRDGKPGISAAEALQQAQAHVRGHPKWKHPYYWAAWTLWGLP